jgi:adhesin transport system outer membrane protein
MPALQVSRADLPTLASLGQEQEAPDPATACPPEAPGMIQIDKEALIAEALRKAREKEK